MPKVAIIVAIGRNGEIGKNNDLVWHLRDDMRHFKTTTLGHPVIMGRKTWESLPNGALPGRRNIVLTSDSGFVASGASTAGSLEKALDMCGDSGKVFIIGGASVYNEALKRADELILTLIDDECVEADAFFPMDFYDEFVTVEESEPMIDKSEISFRFVKMSRKISVKP